MADNHRNNYVNAFALLDLKVGIYILSYFFKYA